MEETASKGKQDRQVPEMTEAIVSDISNRYIELYEHITGEKFVPQDSEDISTRIEQNVTAYLKK